MPFPQGGPVQDVTQDFNIVSSDPVLQAQGIPVYVSPTPFQGLTLAEVIAQITSSFVTDQEFNGAQKTHPLFRFDTIIVGTGTVSQVIAQYLGSYTVFGVPNTFSSFWRMAQFNPGVLPWLPDIFSDLFKYDVANGMPVVTRTSIHFASEVAPTIFTTDVIDANKNLVSTSYYTTISGEVDPCVGDSVPPFITLHSPSVSGIHLRPIDQIVDFSLTDVVGGVDLSTVTVDITSVSTSGTLNIVQNGIDQTGGDVSVAGTATSYRFVYTPPFDWMYNERVLVTISGSDLPPTVDGNPFYCGPASVNTFSGDIPFQVLDFRDLSAEITVVPDSEPPYISSTFPASGTLDNSVFTNVSFVLEDDLAGVDLASLDVAVGGIPIISAGVPTSAETSVVGTTGSYTVTYDPISSFGYGATVEVGVFAKDRAKPTANTLDTSFSFSCIDDSTLVISNFQPDVGTHTNPENLDVVVDVTDATHGVDSDQTFLVINGTIVSGTRVAITDGYQITYHPPNDFAFDEPMRVTVHGTNSDVVAPIIKEAFYSLFYGCRILMFNQEPYNHADNVDVFVRARNNEQLHKDLSTGYFFTTYTQPQSNLGASIEAINPQKDLPATLTVVGPEHRYGETVTVEFSIEDFDGRLLGPYSFTYTIENKPE